MISLIWAMTDDRVIGIENRLPWKLPADMRWFRQHTLGKTVLMGRLTYESFGARPLPERRNIVISRQTNYPAENIDVYPSLDAALTDWDDEEELMVIGGMSIYEQALPLADRLYLTRVHAKLKGDAWFPDFDRKPWQVIETHDFSADEKNPYDYSFQILERKPGSKSSQ